MDSSARREGTYYTTLQVSQQATLEEIKKSYRKLALVLHPDKVEESKRDGAKLQFQELQAAYGILSNLEKKEIYDHELRYSKQNKTFPDTDEDFRFKSLSKSHHRFDFRAYQASQFQNMFDDFNQKFAEQSKAGAARPNGGYCW